MSSTKTGRQISYFTLRDTNEETADAAKVSATSVTASFPMSELEAYGPNFKWSLSRLFVRAPDRDKFTARQHRLRLAPATTPDQ